METQVGITKDQARSVSSQFMTVRQIAKKFGLTNQAVYLMVYQGKVKFERVFTKISHVRSKVLIDVASFKKYRKTRWKRVSKADRTKGEFTVKEFSKAKGIPEQTVYYMARSGKLKTRKEGSTWIIETK